MSQNFIYKRKFIILKDEMTNIMGIKPKGHGKIEVKGSKGYISLNVEKGESNEEYRSYLIGEKNKDIVEAYIGRIFTDNRGKGQIRRDFNINNVENTNLSLKEFNGILIKRSSNILLSAYIDKNDGLLSRYIVKLQEQEGEKEIEPKIEEINQEEPKVEIEEVILQEEKEEELEEIDKIETELEEKLVVEEVKKVEVEKLEEVEELKEKTKTEPEVEEIEIGDIIEEIKEDIKEKEIEKIVEDKINDISSRPKQSYKDYDYIRKQNYKNKLNDYVLSILKFFPYVKPFAIPLKGYEWWKIEYDDGHNYRGFLPFSNYLNNISYNYIFMSNTVSPIDLMEKYNHYLFGMYKEYEDVVYYVYGVPGQFLSTEHPYRGVSGFNTWFEGKEDYGYWLLYIEPITGKILFPLNPMIPLK